MKLPRRKFLHLAAGAAALPVVPRIASAQAYPSRPVSGGAPLIPLVGVRGSSAERRVYPVEVDGTTFDLIERFGGLKDSKIGDQQAIATALGKLLRRALEALLREEAASRH
jgi:hypothetical protein